MMDKEQEVVVYDLRSLNLRSQMERLVLCVVFVWIWSTRATRVVIYFGSRESAWRPEVGCASECT